MMPGAYQSASTRTSGADGTKDGAAGHTGAARR